MPGNLAAEIPATPSLAGTQGKEGSLADVNALKLQQAGPECAADRASWVLTAPTNAGQLAGSRTRRLWTAEEELALARAAAPLAASAIAHAAGLRRAERVWGRGMACTACVGGMRYTRGLLACCLTAVCGWCAPHCPAAAPEAHAGASAGRRWRQRWRQRAACVPPCSARCAGAAWGSLAGEDP